MRHAAALCLYFCSLAAFAVEEHRIQEFDGISAKFTLLNRSVRIQDPLRVALTLHNSSDHPIEFQYLDLLQHADLFGSDLERVTKKNHGPFVAARVLKMRLGPGETVRRTEDMRLSSLYELAPGDYKVGFKYDLRLLPANARKRYQKNLQGQDWVAWDDTLHEFHIRP